MLRVLTGSVRNIRSGHGAFCGMEGNVGVKVLYIAGADRSGSTLLDQLLGELGPCFSGGELTMIWKQGLIRDRSCGCGQPFTSCALWSAVLDHVLPSETPPKHFAERFLSIQEEVLAPKNLIKVLMAVARGGASWPALASYADVYGRLYGAIAAVTGAEVIVDSSKRPQHAAVLPLVHGAEPYLVHLVRDPRGVAFSHRKHLRFQSPTEADPAEMPRATVVGSSRLWMKRNLSAELVKRRYGRDRWLRIRYEDLVRSPVELVQRVGRMVDLTGIPPKDRSGSLVVRGNHMAWGNPSRFKTGALRIRHDDSWVRGLPRRDRLISTGLTAPLLLRYRYPL
jgi:hypothetical protein